MENKTLTPIVIVSLVALLVTGGVSILNKNEFRSETTVQGSSQALGQAITYPSAGNQMETYTLLSAFLTDITAIRTAGGGSLSTSTSWNPGNIATSTFGAPTASTTVTITGAVLGDQIFASLATTTSQDQWIITGKMVAATGTVLVSLTNTGITALDLATTTLYVRAIPYTAAAALTVTATSTP